MPEESPKRTPWKWPSDPARVGGSAQDILSFVHDLWDEETKLRELLTTCKTQEQLRALVRRLGEVPDYVQVVVFDAESGQGFEPERDRSQKYFYPLVLPPRPRGGQNNQASVEQGKMNQAHEEYDKNTQSYVEMQAWAAAAYHAISDSLGM